MQKNNNGSKKHLIVSEDLHSKIKSKAAELKKDLQTFTEELLIKALEE